MRYARILIWITLALLAQRHPAKAQSIVIPDEPRCSNCRLTLVPMTALRADVDDTITLSWSTRYAADSHGHLLAAGLHEPGRIAMFDSAGSLIRTFGRRGQGPGEFMSSIPLLTVDRSDNIHIWEGPRHTILNPDLEGFQQLSIDQVPPVSVAFADSTLAITNLHGLMGYTTHLMTHGTIVTGLEPAEATQPEPQ